MTALDYFMLALYFLGMFVLGVMAMNHTKTQSDYFLGGRSFGKLLQTFAAFGAGTGAHEPVLVGRAVWTSGLSGVWTAMQWLFVTPIYWITAVWYRRMRHLTLGDWFVERYESRALGVAYTIYALVFYMAFLSTMLTAIAKFAVPLLGVETIGGWPISHVIVPLLALTVVGYGVLGGLTAAYWTDLVQGILIIVLSILLLPFGLVALTKVVGDQPPTWVSGFEVLHDQLPADYFSLFGGPASGEFPLLYIVCFSLLSLVGIVVQPHFIATGGGSAKSEYEARFGLVVGNYLKRICTIGWAITGLIALALLADNPEIAMDPDRAWGVASREILGPLNLGLVGVMFACLLAAMMSSADAYMLVSSALVVRNVYAAYLDPNASEARYVWVGRLTGIVLVVGATVVSLIYTNVLGQFRFAMEIPILFAAPFWLGLFWRRVNTWAVWLTITFSLFMFFVLPIGLPNWLPSLRQNETFQQTTVIETVTTTRPAAPADVARHQAWSAAKQQIEQVPDEELRAKKLKDLGSEPPFAPLGQAMQVKTVTGGRSIYWQEIQPADPDRVRKVLISEVIQGEQTVRRERWEGPMIGIGPLNFDFLIYAFIGVDLSEANKATLEALRLPTRLVLPFGVLIALSYLTPRNRVEALDRYFVKMKTPVAKDPVTDDQELRLSYENPKRFEHLRMFPGSDWEMLRPTKLDIIGFILSAVVAALIIWLLVWVSNIGATPN
jgi:SSS family solute:Na+ symporter